jgi:hypothetical protein
MTNIICVGCGDILKQIDDGRIIEGIMGTDSFDTQKFDICNRCLKVELSN